MLHKNALLLILVKYTTCYCFQFHVHVYLGLKWSMPQTHAYIQPENIDISLTLMSIYQYLFETELCHHNFVYLRHTGPTYAHRLTDSLLL